MHTDETDAEQPAFVPRQRVELWVLVGLNTS